MVLDAPLRQASSTHQVLNPRSARRQLRHHPRHAHRGRAEGTGAVPTVRYVHAGSGDPMHGLQPRVAVGRNPAQRRVHPLLRLTDVDGGVLYTQREPPAGQRSLADRAGRRRGTDGVHRGGHRHSPTERGDVTAQPGVMFVSPDEVSRRNMDAEMGTRARQRWRAAGAWCKMAALLNFGRGHNEAPYGCFAGGQPEIELFDRVRTGRTIPSGGQRTLSVARGR